MSSSILSFDQFFETTNDPSLALFYGAQTYVIWEFEECPIPDGLDCSDVSSNIRSALDKLGYCGSVSMKAYGDISKIKSDFDEFIIAPVHAGTRRMKIVADVLGRAVSHRYSRVNFMLILGDISGHSGLMKLIRVLKSTGSFNVILSQPRNASSGQLLDVVSSVWRWESLSAKGLLIDNNQTGDLDYDGTSSDSEAEDNSTESFPPLSAPTLSFGTVDRNKKKPMLGPSFLF